MPWNFVPGLLKVKNELIRKVNAMEPVNNTELTAQVRQLITEYPALIKWLDKQPLKMKHLLLRISTVQYCLTTVMPHLNIMHCL